MVDGSDRSSKRFRESVAVPKDLGGLNFYSQLCERPSFPAWCCGALLHAVQAGGVHAWNVLTLWVTTLK
jgi:hypothetical protein